jgi:hypothetical protein
VASMNDRILVASVAAICLTASALSAEAQGNGRGNAYGKRNQGASGGAAADAAAGAPAGSSQTDSSPGQPAGVGVRNFGAWLDDASVLAAGRGMMTLSFAYWRTPAYREVDVPVVDAGIGLSRRVQFGFSVPYYHAHEPGGPIARGVGDLYFTTKVQLREPSSADRHLGFAVTPLVEILSFAPGPDRSRVSWALPANVEWQGDGWRAFGSGGYFSRGAVFGSGALEIAISDSAWVNASMSESYSLERDDVSTAMGLARLRMDVSGGTGFSLSPNVALFGLVGRTMSKQDVNSATFFFTGGITISFDAHPPSAPHR